MTHTASFSRVENVYNSMFHSNPRAAAKSHIQKIREEFGVHSGKEASRVVAALEKSLETLSDQLNTSSTHFLLELIQNADDNEYVGSSPSLSFTYVDRTLRVECNEQGFSSANVEAICRIGESTKKNKTESQTGHIGEKGIGFKSVFKVADKVWISSNAYNFCFDKAAPLGMVAPKWDDTYRKSDPAGTLMVLQLSPDYDEHELLRELSDLDPRMLIFLRKLRSIDVKFVSNGITTWSTNLNRVDGDVYGEPAIQLRRGSDVFRYVIHTHPVTGLPATTRREGINKSEIVLAFPVVDGELSELPTESAYAFLPIRDYGFKFLIQGDFLLSASREDILSPCAWNTALRNAFVEAFVTTIKHKHQKYLQHLWPLFLPSGNGRGHQANNFFSPAVDSIIKALKSQPMLLNYDGQLCKPGDLFLVPPEFRRNDADTTIPLLLSPKTRTHYLSDVYGEACETALLSLGVHKMTLKDFVKDLAVVVTEESTFYKSQTKEWHSSLALRIMPSLETSDRDRSQRDRMRRLVMVPLQNGLWCTPSESGVFLPGVAQSSSNVQGIGVKLVHVEAAGDKARASLFEHLGITQINEAELCQLIATFHRQPRSALPLLRRTELVSQIKFLFKAGWRNNDQQDFWFASESGDIHTGSSMYLQSTRPHTASQYASESNNFTTLLASLKFIHADYFADVSVEGDRKIFMDWLQQCMLLNNYLRIFHINRLATTAESAVHFSDEFKAITSSEKSFPWLVMLKDNWRHYEEVLNLNHFMESSGITNSAVSADALRDRHRLLLGQIGDFAVKCIDGSCSPLKNTYLPLPVLKEDVISGIALVDLPVPEDSLWKPLKCLGLGTEADLMFYMRCLERLSEDSQKGNSIPNASSKATTYLEQIQARHTEDIGLVKSWFDEKCLIRVNPSRSGRGIRWVNSPLCLWEGPKCCRHLPILKEMYPGCETLFHKVLGIKNFTTVNLADEAALLEIGDDLQHIHELFLEIQKQVEKFEPQHARLIKRLTKIPMFPIIGPGRRHDNFLPYDELVAVNSNTLWFIADRRELYESFIGRVPLLAFNMEQFEQLKNLFDKFGLERARLGRCATSKPSSGTRAEYKHSRSLYFRNRAEFILRLLPSSIPMTRKRLLANLLQRIEAYEARSLTQDWSVTLNDGSIVRGRPSPCSVLLSTTDEALQIYLVEGYMERTKYAITLYRSLIEYCDIPANRELLLSMALLNDPEQIEDHFEKEGIPKLDSRILSNEPIEDEAEPTPDQPEEQTSGTNGDYTERLVSGKKGDARREGNSNTTGIPCPHCQNAAMGSSMQPGPENGIPNIAAPEISIVALDNILSTQGEGPSQSMFGNIKVFGVAGPSLDPRMGSLALGNTQKRPIDPKIQFKGQNLFSMELARILGDVYNPNDHWTSPLRSRAGHTDFWDPNGQNAAFTVPDPSGILTNALCTANLVSPEWLERPPTWHFEVETTEGGLDSPFYLTNAQVERARETCYGLNYGRSETLPTDVVVLVRVYNINDERPSTAWYPDFWTLYMYEQLDLKANSYYKCGVVVDA